MLADLNSPLQNVAYQELLRAPRPGPDLQAPRLPVTAEPLEQLGIIGARSNNPADMELALKIIDYVIKEGAKTEIEVSLIPLKSADATSVANTLNQLFSRVVVGPFSNTQIQLQTGARPAAQQGGTGQPGGIGGGSGGAQPGGVGQQQSQSQVGQAAASLVIIPIVRQNAILLAVPKSRMDNIKQEIARLDVPIADDARPVAFPLKNAAAGRVATLITGFYQSRFPNETYNMHQVRITSDDGTNTVFVQAAPADMAEIRSLIEHIDSNFSNAVNELRIVPLRSAVADDLALILSHAVTENIILTTGPAAPTVTAPGGLGGLGAPGGLGALAGQTINQTLPRQTKAKALRFLSSQKNGKALESGIFEDVRISSDARTNSLIIDAPPKTMELILAVIKEMDVPPFAKAEVQVFTLKNIDAVQTATTLQQLFLNSGGLTSTGTTTAGAGRHGRCQTTYRRRPYRHHGREASAINRQRTLAGRGADHRSAPDGR